jgi:hypothetical protein
VNRDVQYVAGLEHSVDDPPNPPVFFLQNQNVARLYERHGRRLT